MEIKTVRLSNDPWSMALLNKIKTSAHYATLAVWEKNKNIPMNRTPYWQWLMGVLKTKGTVWGGVLNSEDDVNKRCEIFKSMVDAAPNWKVPESVITRTVNANGRLETWHYGPVCVRVEDDGHFTLFDGNHRLAILLFKNMPISVRISERSEAWSDLVLSVEKLYPTGAVYQPIPHPEFSDWKSSLDTTKERFLEGWMTKNGVRDVVDLGTCHGYTMYELRHVIKKGTGVESDELRTRIVDLVLGHIHMESVRCSIEDYLARLAAGRVHRQCIMALNVLHHVMKFNDRTKFERMMSGVKNNCDYFIYSLPVEREGQVAWMYDEARRNPNYISEITGMVEVESLQMKIRKLVILKKR